MRRRYSGVTQDRVPEMIKRGLGQGTGPNYLPWIFIYSISSHGLSSRIPGWTTGRLHHLLSQHERRFFYWMDWLLDVVDIREQFPLLPLSDSVAIARKYDLPHPSDQQTGEPVVMTSDFRLTEIRGTRKVDVIRSIKPANKLGSIRTVKRLELERLFWQEKGVEWALVTDHSIPRVLVSNVEFVHAFFKPSSVAPLTDADVRCVKNAVIKTSLDLSECCFSELIDAVSFSLGYPRMQTVAVIKHLTASRQLPVDMHHLITPSSPLRLGQ